MTVYVSRCKSAVDRLYLSRGIVATVVPILGDLVPR